VNRSFVASRAPVAHPLRALELLLRAFNCATHRNPENLARLFVHASAFPRDGSRPTVGESLTYELGRGKDGRPQAVRVQRKALARTAYSRPASRLIPRRHSAGTLIGLVLLVALAGYGYEKFRARDGRLSGRMSAPVAAGQETVEIAPGGYQCDGRTHCSQMNSCAEATFFLKNCPGTRMDGNNDGVPCEQQWCTSAFAR